MEAGMAAFYSVIGVMIALAIVTYVLGNDENDR